MEGISTALSCAHLSLFQLSVEWSQAMATGERGEEEKETPLHVCTACFQTQAELGCHNARGSTLTQQCVAIFNYNSLNYTLAS